MKRIITLACAAMAIPAYLFAQSYSIRVGDESNWQQVIEVYRTMHNSFYETIIPNKDRRNAYIDQKMHELYHKTFTDRTHHLINCYYDLHTDDVLGHDYAGYLIYRIEGSVAWCTSFAYIKEHEGCSITQSLAQYLLNTHPQIDTIYAALPTGEGAFQKYRERFESLGFVPTNNPVALDDTDKNLSDVVMGYQLPLP